MQAPSWLAPLSGQRGLGSPTRRGLLFPPVLTGPKGGLSPSSSEAETSEAASKMSWTLLARPC